MKKLFVLGMAAMLACTAAVAQDSKAKPASANALASGPVITFAQNKFDFGTATEGEKVEHRFMFTNTGNQPLILSNVQTTCGCTVPEWPKDPIMPGGKGVIKATFDTTGKIGQQNKVITIISNSREGNTTVSVNGNVKGKADVTGAAKPAADPHAGHKH